MIRATLNFPQGFLWGTATASHQVEGENDNNDWSDWETQSGRIRQGHRSGKACDWWGGRWQEDLDRATQSGQNTHRLSVEWSRIEPNSAVWDDSAVDFYRQVLQGAIDRGLTPMVTLHHFTSPRWISEQGGWAAPETPGRFERYVRKIVGSLKDLANLWVTINEPNVYAFSGYFLGTFPPGEKSLGRAFQVLENMVSAHAAAYQAIHELQPSARVGVAHHYRGVLPFHPSNPLDRAVAGFRFRVLNDFFPVALHQGSFGILGRTFRFPKATRTQDFFGLNYYTVERCAFDPLRPLALFMRDLYPPGSDLSGTGFLANEPDGFTRSMQWATRFGLPIYITENGVEDADDRMRPRYLALHLHRLWHEVNLGIPVRGYYHWSLVDNFEWERGWTQRFGLWELILETQERRKRRSADFYAEVCRSNSLSTEMVGEFAPEVFERLFPTRSPGTPGIVQGFE
jgi:beta-glucosidase